VEVRIFIVFTNVAIEIIPLMCNLWKKRGCRCGPIYFYMDLHRWSGAVQLVEKKEAVVAVLFIFTWIFIEGVGHTDVCPTPLEIVLTNRT